MENSTLFKYFFNPSIKTAVTLSFVRRKTLDVSGARGEEGQPETGGEGLQRLHPQQPGAARIQGRHQRLLHAGHGDVRVDVDVGCEGIFPFG